MPPKTNRKTEFRGILGRPPTVRKSDDQVAYYTQLWFPRSRDANRNRARLEADLLRALFTHYNVSPDHRESERLLIWKLARAAGVPAFQDDPKPRGAPSKGKAADVCVSILIAQHILEGKGMPAGLKAACRFLESQGVAEGLSADRLYTIYKRAQHDIGVKAEIVKSLHEGGKLLAPFVESMMRRKRRASRQQKGH